jgi:hypothetical protein
VSRTRSGIAHQRLQCAAAARATSKSMFMLGTQKKAALPFESAASEEINAVQALIVAAELSLTVIALPEFTQPW